MQNLLATLLNSRIPVKLTYHPAKANVVADALSRKSCGGEVEPEELIE
jgi:hypothetical protein